MEPIHDFGNVQSVIMTDLIHKRRDSVMLWFHTSYMVKKNITKLRSSIAKPRKLSIRRGRHLPCSFEKRKNLLNLKENQEIEDGAAAGHGFW